jgi:hypothetical protein
MLQEIFDRFSGRQRKPPKPELQQDEDRIHSAAFKPTLDACAKYVLDLFVLELEKMEEGSTTVHKAGDKADDKAAVGMAWIPAFVLMYASRLERADWPKEKAPTKTPQQKADAATAVAQKIKEIARSLTYEMVQGMTGVAMKLILRSVKYPNADKLGKKNGTCFAAFVKHFNLKPAAAAAAATTTTTTTTTTATTTPAPAPPAPPA